MILTVMLYNLLDLEGDVLNQEEGCSIGRNQGSSGCSEDGQFGNSLQGIQIAPFVRKYVLMPFECQTQSQVHEEVIL